jgi:hypothetical protein
MPFEEYYPVRQHRTRKPGLWLSNNAHLSISYEVGQQLGLPERVRLDYDREGKQIRVSAVKDTDRHGIKTVWDRPRASSRSATNTVRQLARVMPSGFYVPVGGNVFVHESQMK